MPKSDFVKIKLPLPLLNALHDQMITTGQTETEVLLAALSAYFNIQTQQHSPDLKAVSAQQELTVVQQKVAVIQQRLAIVEQTLSLISPSAPSTSQQQSPSLAAHITISTIESDDTEDEPDEILYGFLAPEDR